MKIEVKKICYVCGLELDDYPYSLGGRPIANENVICPCCGTHYGLDDEGGGDVDIPDDIVNAYKNFADDGHKKIIKILRQNWVDGGMKWKIPEDVFHPTPDNWDPQKQLENVPEEFK